MARAHKRTPVNVVSACTSTLLLAWADLRGHMTARRNRGWRDSMQETCYHQGVAWLYPASCLTCEQASTTLSARGTSSAIIRQGLQRAVLQLTHLSAGALSAAAVVNLPTAVGVDDGCPAGLHTRTAHMSEKQRQE